MKSLMTFIGVLIFVAAVCAVFYGGYVAVGYVWQLYVTIDSTMRLILLSSFAVFLLGCFILAGAVKSSAQLKNRGRLGEVKINLYKTLIGLYESVLSESQAVTAQSQKERQIRLGELNAEMSLVAESSVIEAHRKLETALNNGADEDKLHASYQQLIRKMRRDLGHGANINETRLGFLVIGDHNAQTDSRNYSVSV